MADDITTIVKTYEHDRYIASLFAPDDKRNDLLSLYAFNAEVSRIRYIVSEPQIGEIRLQFWTDTLESIGQGEAQNHPVALGLQKAISTHRLPIEPLQRLVLAHEFDLYADHFPSLNDVEGYLGETSSVLIQLSAMILDRPLAEKHAGAAGLAGVAYGLARHVAQLEFMPTLLPQSATVSDLKALAQKRLNELQSHQIPEAIWPAYLPATLTPLYLKSLPAPWRKQWQLWRAAKRGRF